MSNNKTLTQLRKEITLSDAANVRTILQYFELIALSNPDAVRNVFSQHLSRKSDATQLNMVQFYADHAARLKEMFDLD